MTLTIPGTLESENNTVLSTEKNPEPYGTQAVSTELGICSEAGNDILKKGGNALDAAISSALCIGVINSFSSGIGGGGFLLIRIPERKVHKLQNFAQDKTSGKRRQLPTSKYITEDEHIHMLDFRETAPKNINIRNYTEHFANSKTTGTSVATPGEIMGFYQAHSKYGKLKWEELFKASIKLAENGFVPPQLLIEKLKKNRDFILDDEGLRNTYSRFDKNKNIHSLVDKNDIVKRTNYAETLKALSKSPMDFYTGKIADKIVNFIQKNQGDLSHEDMSTYKAVERSPIKENILGFTIYTTNMPTSGVIVLEALKLMEEFRIKSMKHLYNNDKTGYYHYLTEIFKFIESKRGCFGDPDSVKDRSYTKIIKQLLSDQHIKSTHRKISMTETLSNKDYGMKYNYQEDHGTTHINVVDSNEMSAQITTTINLEFGSKLMDPETGIIFNNHIDDFSIPCVTNSYDLPFNKSNELCPKKRAFSSASPIILKNKNDIIFLGAAGGSKIPTSIIGVLSYMFVGLSLKEAIDAPRIHHQLIPNFLYVEPSFSKDLISGLESRKHRVKISPEIASFTSVQGIHLHRTTDEHKVIYAVSDPRKSGISAGV